MDKSIKVHMLLYHASHGLCRVNEILPTTEKRAGSIKLVPVNGASGKVQFEVPVHALENSGFNVLITELQAIAILAFLKNGKSKDNSDSNSWKRAEYVYKESTNTTLVRDVRKRQKIETAVKGIVGDIAQALHISIPIASERVKGCLASHSEINGSVLHALKKIQNS